MLLLWCLVSICEYYTSPTILLYAYNRIKHLKENSIDKAEYVSVFHHVDRT